MNKAIREFSSKRAARKFLSNNVDYFYADGESGAIPFGGIFLKEKTITATSEFWQSSSLKDFLHGRRKLEQ
jgi:hypothetical protein